MVFHPTSALGRIRCAADGGAAYSARGAPMPGAHADQLVLVDTVTAAAVSRSSTSMTSSTTAGRGGAEAKPILRSSSMASCSSALSDSRSAALLLKGFDDALGGGSGSRTDRAAIHQSAYRFVDVEAHDQMGAALPGGSPVGQ